MENQRDFCIFYKEGKYDKAIESLNKLLITKPNNGEYLYGIYVCMIEQERFIDALEFINKNAKYYNMNYEKAYCQYRLNKCNDALLILKKISNHGLKEKELMAQIYYKLFNFKDSCDIYQNLVKSTQDDYDEERICNLLASLAFKCDDTILNNFEGKFEHSNYDIYSNLGYIHIMNKNYDIALNYLSLAKKTCKEFYQSADQLSELKAELNNLDLLTAYVYQAQGKSHDALLLYQTLKKEHGMTSISMITTNNEYILNQEYQQEYKRMLKKLNDSQIMLKLNENQIKDLHANHIIYCLKNNLLDLVKPLIKNFETRFSDDKLRSALFNIAILLKDKKRTKFDEILPKQLKSIQELSNSNPKLQSYTKFCEIQLHINQGKFSVAADLIQQIPDVYKFPQLVKYLIYLRNLQDSENDSSRSGTSSPVKTLLTADIKESTTRKSPTPKRNIDVSVDVYLKAINSFLDDKKDNDPLLLAYLKELIKLLPSSICSSQKALDISDDGGNLQRIASLLEHLSKNDLENKEYQGLLLNVYLLIDPERALKYANDVLMTHHSNDLEVALDLDKELLQKFSLQAKNYNLTRKYWKKIEKRKSTDKVNLVTKTAATLSKKDDDQKDVLVDTRKKGTALLRQNALCLKRRRIRQKAKRLAYLKSKPTKSDLHKPSSGVDPERWLPKHMRTTKIPTINLNVNRKKRYNKGLTKKDDIGRGTQGSTAVVTAANENLNFSTMSKPNVNNNTVVGNVSQGPPGSLPSQATTTMGKVQMVKKKKKKIKW